jgi:WD40 repeat protein
MTKDDNISYAEFAQANIPPYAILSHTWGVDEVLLDDLASGAARSKAGYRKILFCGHQAARDDLRYFWVDTCCIDKRNLVELTRAINSMFRWYRNAAKCYVYMSDVTSATPSRQRTWERDFRRSRWFTRGWTLQELLAPTEVEFFSRHHLRLGDKESLCGLISQITSISELALQGHPLEQLPIPTRMAWAANRQTTEEEDGAYCLLGIFNIFMPLIYGEGKENALRRLQREIDGLPPTSLVQHPIKPVDAHFTTSRESELSMISRAPAFESSTVFILKNESVVHAVAFSPTGKQLASGSNDRAISLWDVTSIMSTHLSRKLTGHSAYVHAVEYSSDSGLLASCSSHEAILWDVELGLQLHTFDVNKSIVLCVAFSPDCRSLAIGSNDSFLRVWNVQKNKKTESYAKGPRMQQRHQGAVCAVAFSPDGELLASGASSGTIWLSNASSGNIIQTISGHSSIIYTITFSSDNKLLASSGRDGKIQIYQETVSNGSERHWTLKFADLYQDAPKQVQPFRSQSVYGVAFSPNGKLLASCGSDNIVILWDTSSGKLVLVLHGHTECVLNLSFSQDGRLLASCGRDKTIRIWKALDTIPEITDSEDSTAVLFDVTKNDDVRIHSSGLYSC